MHSHAHSASLEHDHGQALDANSARATRALLWALSITVAFMGVEVWAGLVFGSLALLADAAHMASDAAALGLSFFVSRIALRPRDHDRTFGYRRAEVIGALANASAMFVVAAWIFVEAIQRFGDHGHAIHGGGMAVTAALGLCVNLGVAAILAGASDNLNVRSALLHVLGDTLGSIAALVAGGIIVWTGWRMADPIASAIIAIVMSVGALRLLRECLHVLMQGAPANIDCGAVEETIRQTEGVAEVHDLHVWSLTAGAPILSAHIVLEAGQHGTEIARVVGQRLRALHQIHHVTIQPEASPPIVQLRVGDQGPGSRN